MTPKSPDRSTKTDPTPTTVSRLTSPRSLVELAYERLLSMLVTLTVRPGEHIGIETLARELKISQTPIREALNLLEAQRLVFKLPNVGFRAADLLTPEDISSLFELRLMIEPRAAALAAERADALTLGELREVASEMAREARATGVSYARFAENDARLHHLVASASGNVFLSEVVQGLHAHLHIFRYLYNTNAPQKAVEEHEAIVEALIARDAEWAETAMRAHLAASNRRMDCATHDQSPVDSGKTPRRPGHTATGRAAAAKHTRRGSHL